MPIGTILLIVLAVLLIAALPGVGFGRHAPLSAPAAQPRMMWLLALNGHIQILRRSRNFRKVGALRRGSWRSASRCPCFDNSSPAQ
jgi:hypothetical protein